MNKISHWLHCCSEAKSVGDFTVVSKISYANSHKSGSANNGSKITENYNSNNSSVTKQNPRPSINKGSVNPGMDTSIVTFSNIKIRESIKSLPICDTEVMNTNELKLIGEIFWNKEITIDRLGIKVPKRKKRDGITFFGVNEDRNEAGHPYSDFILNLPTINEKDSELRKTPLFLIKYDNDKEIYQLVSLMKEAKIYHLINYDFFFGKNSNKEFLIGKIKFCLVVLENKETEEMSLLVKINTESEGGYSEYHFTNDKMPISIGRSNSTINIKNSSISKTHVIINYSEGYNAYYLRDNESTNGTYFVMGYKTGVILLNEMKFKLFESKFMVSEVD